MQLNAQMVGANFRPAKAREIVKNLFIGETDLTLEPEPDNPYDDHAVKVMYQGEHIGYIERSNNSALHEALVDGSEASVEIIGFATTLKPLLEITVE